MPVFVLNHMCLNDCTDCQDLTRGTKQCKLISIGNNIESLLNAK